MTEHFDGIQWSEFLKNHPELAGGKEQPNPEALRTPDANTDTPENVGGASEDPKFMDIMHKENFLDTAGKVIDEHLKAAEEATGITVPRLDTSLESIRKYNEPVDTSVPNFDQHHEAFHAASEAQHIIGQQLRQNPREPETMKRYQMAAEALDSHHQALGGDMVRTYNGTDMVCRHCKQELPHLRMNRD